MKIHCTKALNNLKSSVNNCWTYMLLLFIYPYPSLHFEFSCRHLQTMLLRSHLHIHTGLSQQEKKKKSELAFDKREFSCQVPRNPSVMSRFSVAQYTGPCNNRKMDTLSRASRWTQLHQFKVQLKFHHSFFLGKAPVSQSRLCSVKWDAQILFRHSTVVPTRPKPTSNIGQVLVHGISEEHAVGADVGS